ncbi:MAG: Ig domain-containing protein, partial [Clostridia bacterium]|nr:Ig domain-containing protein [Clostridia bacterium]
MKKTIRTISLLLALCLIAAAAPALPLQIAPLFGQAAYAAAAPKLSKTKASLAMGEKITLKVLNAGKKTVTWTSSNKKVAAVSAKGVVKAVTPGKATITAKVGSKKLTAAITVKKPSLSQTDVKVGPGEAVQLKVKNGGGLKVTWSTSNARIATVSANGVVKGIREGYATITAKVGKVATLRANVAVPQPTFDGIPAVLAKGFSANAVVKYAGANKATWHSSNPNVASINSVGRITAKAVGDTIISARVGRYRIEVTLRVIKKPYITFETGTMMIGDKQTFSIIGSGDSPAAWSVNDKSLAAIDAKGVLTAKKGGLVTVSGATGSRDTIRSSWKPKARSSSRNAVASGAAWTQLPMRRAASRTP